MWKNILHKNPWISLLKDVMISFLLKQTKTRVREPLS